MISSVKNTYQPLLAASLKSFLFGRSRPWRWATLVAALCEALSGRLSIPIIRNIFNKILRNFTMPSTNFSDLESVR